MKIEYSQMSLLTFIAEPRQIIHALYSALKNLREDCSSFSRHYLKNGKLYQLAGKKLGYSTLIFFKLTNYKLILGHIRQFVIICALCNGGGSVQMSYHIQGFNTKCSRYGQIDNRKTALTFSYI